MQTYSLNISHAYSDFKVKYNNTEALGKSKLNKDEIKNKDI